MEKNRNVKTETQFAELVSFISDKSGKHDIPITRQTLIEDDLGITGEDAYDLIKELSKKYQINISGFNFAKYFNEEPLMFLPDRKVIPFTVAHLEKAIIAGRLDEEVINS